MNTYPAAPAPPGLRTALVAILTCVFTALLAAPCRADDLTPEKRKQDPRLEKLVSIREPRTCVGEILEELSRQTGVRVEARIPDQSSDFMVTAFLERVPLGDAMKSLWSLMSLRKAEWYWLRQGRPGAYRYVLMRPLAAREARAFLREQVQARFEAHAQTMIEAASMSPQDRAKLAERDEIVRRCLRDERVWGRVRLFAELVPPAKRQAVLRGAPTERVRVEDLSAEGRAFVEAETALHVRPESPRPAPEWVQAETVLDVARRGTPSSYVQMDWMGGYSCFGGTPFREQNERDMADLWMLPGDSHHRPAIESRRLAHQPPEPPAPPPPPPGLRGPAGDAAAEALDAARRIHFRRVDAFGKDAGLSLLALLPARVQRDPGPAAGKSIGEYLEVLKGRMALIRKWRGNVLLCTYAQYYTGAEDEHTVPYEVARKLAAAVSAEKDGLSLADLAGAAGLTSPQSVNLEHRYPELRFVVMWRGLFRLHRQVPHLWEQMTGPHGAPLSTVINNATEHAPVLAPLDREGVRIFLTAAELPGGPPGRVFTVRVASGQKELIRSVVTIRRPSGPTGR